MSDEKVVYIGKALVGNEVQDVTVVAGKDGLLHVGAPAIKIAPPVPSQAVTVKLSPRK